MAIASIRKTIIAVAAFLVLGGRRECAGSGKYARGG